jgi:hypothetical protein
MVQVVQVMPLVLVEAALVLFPVQDHSLVVVVL